MINIVERGMMKEALIIGHRGCSAIAPENTLAALGLAYEMGADGVEFDVKLTRDRQVVLLHDPTVDRTTDGKGSLKDLDLADLQRFDAGSWKNEKYKGEKIPLLAEVFDHFGDKMLLNIEITNYTTPSDGSVDEIFKVIRASGKKMELIFSSFYAKNLRATRSIDPRAKVAQLIMPGVAGWGQRFMTRANELYAIHPHHLDVNAGYVSAAKKQGKKINVWTVNGEEKILKVLRKNVDGIITDNVEETRSIMVHSLNV